MKEKFKSRKFMMSLISVICGILGMFNMADTTVNSVGSILMVVLPAVAYIITEGRIDTQRLIAAAKEVIDIVDGEGDDLQMYK